MAFMGIEMGSVDTTSDRITRLRFPLIFLVILIHSWNPSLQSFPATDVVQSVVSREVPSGAVPLLFLISGYLFYRQEAPTISVYRRKMRSRLHTLVVPYLIWNAAALGVQVIGQLTPATSKYFTGGTLDVSHLAVFDVLNAFCGFNETPINGPLWFLKYLIIVSMISPVLWHICRKGRVYVVFALLVLYVLPWPSWMRHSVFAIVFFSLGLYISQFPVDIRRHEVWFLILYPILVAAKLVGESQGVSSDVLMKLCTLLSIGFWWAAAGRLHSGVLVRLAPAAFFAYVGHGIILQTVRKGVWALHVPQSELPAVLVYLIPPIAATMLLIAGFGILNRWSPAILGVLCGGRSGSEPARVFERTCLEPVESSTGSRPSFRSKEELIRETVAAQRYGAGG